MWKTSIIIIIVLLIGTITLIGDGSANQQVGGVILAPNVKLNTLFGNVVTTNQQNLNKIIVGSPTGGIIQFNVTGIAPIQRFYIFTVNTYGNGTLRLQFIGPKPLVITSGMFSVLGYSGGVQQITYSGVNNVGLTLDYGSIVVSEFTQSQKVLFIDDFLYTNPQLETSWTIDQYQSPQTSPGEYTTSGYLIMPAKSTSSLETVHVNTPMFDPSAEHNGTIVKRKMTVGLIPFSKTESPATADIRAGLTTIVTTGSYPGSSPSGTPNVDATNNCLQSSVTADNLGLEYMDMSNVGTVLGIICGDFSGSRTVRTLATGLNPSLYTVFTIETYGIFCNTCSDNAYSATSWIWFRVYQRDGSGRIVSGSDQNTNITSGVAPLLSKSYAFVSQLNSNSAVTGQISSIDVVQIQNYGSPVCLIVASGTFCTNFPNVPGSFGQGVISDIAWLTNQIGYGDPQVGAIILFFVLSGAFCFIPLIFTRNYLIAGEGELVVIGFFTFAGFLPEWVIIIPILGGAVLMVMLIRKMVSGYSFGGGGE